MASRFCTLWEQWNVFGVPMRTLQEWLGHRDFKTTLIYADYSPSEREREWIEVAFGRAEAGLSDYGPSMRNRLKSV